MNGAALKYQLKHYGLTVAEYNEILLAQCGTCAICHRPERIKLRGGSVSRLAVDHDEATDTVRGLLCRDCNTAIGLLGHDHLRLGSAIAYLVAVR